VTSIVSHEISTKLIPATSLQNLFLEMLDPIEDQKAISLDIMASAMRSPSIVDGSALIGVLFNQGLHALVCHRLSHRLWQKDRTGLAYYIQSTVSRQYSTDIHPAATFGNAIYLNAGSAGVVIGETAVIDDDVTILQGVTLGGTGKERGDRHPKVKKNAILQQHCSVLGNIEVGEGAIIAAKSIVTKPVPKYTKVNGVPAKIIGSVTRYTPPELLVENDSENMSTNDATDATENDKIRRIKELLRKHSAFLLDDGNL
jgi:serine O-acetyltransferase